MVSPKIRTLIVDDEPLARERIRQLLRKEPDIEILGECADGRDAAAAIGRYKPDLVFLDVQMPELDGFGVLEQLDRRAMPAIVFVTAHDQFALRAFEVHALADAGTIGTKPPPVGGRSLEDAIDEVLT